METYEQMDIFDLTLPKFQIDKPIRLIELFAGIGSQAMALRDLGADFESYVISEWEVNANRSYKAIHYGNDTQDYSKKIKKFKWLVRILYEIGVSVDGKNPLAQKQIRQRGENWCRQIYNEFHATHNIGSISKRSGMDLRIVDTESFTYLLTYSFPCQDLSVAGKQKGMSKGSGTRSGLLWEVERLLNEVDNLPQVLLMENVPQVHSEKNMPDFQKWIDFLSSKGYANYWQDLNAKDYGVAQNRDRTFMVSILGKYNYKFPQPIPLTKIMKDYLEEEVLEKYYINTEKAKKLIDTLIQNGTIPKSRAEQSRAEQSRAEQSDTALTSLLKNREQTKSQTVSQQEMTEAFQTEKQRVPVLLKNQGSELEKVTDIANTLMARDYKGFGNQSMNGVIEWK